MRDHLVTAGWLGVGLVLLPIQGSGGAGARSLRVEPERVELPLGGRRQLRAQRAGAERRRERSDAGDAGSAVRWQVVNGVGTVTEAGLYTAPLQADTPAAAVLRVEAGEKSGEGRVLIPAVRVRVQTERSRLRLGETCRLRATVDGAEDTRVEWSVDGGSEHGSISSAGVYAAPERHRTPATITVRARSVADPSKSAVTALRLEPVTVEIRPRETRLRLGEMRRFAAVVGGAEQTGVRWSVMGEGHGAISPTGLYTPPESISTPAVVTITATSEADPTKVAQARVRIAELGLRITPMGVPRSRGRSGPKVSATVYRVVRLSLPLDPLDRLVRFPFFRGRSGKIYVPLGGAYQFRAEADGSETEVRWSLEGRPEDGSISEDGLYRAPERMVTPQVVRVVARSAVDPGRRAAAMLHIPPVYLEGGARRPTAPLGGAVALKARVKNSENDRVRWVVEGGPGRGTVSESGLFRPAEPLTTPATVLVRAVSDADETKSLVFEVRVPEVSVRVSPAKATVRPGATLRLRARVRGALNGAVRWHVDPPLSTISPSGTFTAPADLRHEAEVIVTAVSLADPTKSGRTVVRLMPQRS